MTSSLVFCWIFLGICIEFQIRNQLLLLLFRPQKWIKTFEMDSFVNESLLTWVWWMPLGGSKWGCQAARWPPIGRWCRKGNVCWCISWCLKRINCENIEQTLNPRWTHLKRWRTARRGGGRQREVVTSFIWGRNPSNFTLAFAEPKQTETEQIAPLENFFLTRTPLSANRLLSQRL